ncbi:MAG: hypothetical protein CMJ23_08425 [Phycisphaerae bacterium]|nr:hypothetical protein [Phycisphaerae bacterium]
MENSDDAVWAARSDAFRTLERGNSSDEALCGGPEVMPGHDEPWRIRLRIEGRKVFPIGWFVGGVGDEPARIMNRPLRVVEGGLDRSGRAVQMRGTYGDPIVGRPENRTR